MKVRCVMWGWREQADLKGINQALQQVFDGKNVPCINYVRAGSDFYVVVVSASMINEAKAEDVYENYTYPSGYPLEEVLDIEWLPNGLARPK